jgi:hypothetical protein
MRRNGRDSRHLAALWDESAQEGRNELMTDQECVALLQWALPRLGLRWSGFRRVRRQVCKRISRRMTEPGLGAAAYRNRLGADAAE